jgi:hypothetical protein
MISRYQQNRINSLFGAIRVDLEVLQVVVQNGILLLLALPLSALSIKSVDVTSSISTYPTPHVRKSMTYQECVQNP